MTIKIRPFWLPREIACVLIILIYCPIFESKTSSKVKEVVARIHTTVETAERENPNSAVIILGDFNSASVNLRRYKQNVTFATRDNKILDNIYIYIYAVYCEGPSPASARSSWSSEEICLQ